MINVAFQVKQTVICATWNGEIYDMRQNQIRNDRNKSSLINNCLQTIFCWVIRFLFSSLYVGREKTCMHLATWKAEHKLHNIYWAWVVVSDLYSSVSVWFVYSLPLNESMFEQLFFCFKFRIKIYSKKYMLLVLLFYFSTPVIIFTWSANNFLCKLNILLDRRLTQQKIQRIFHTLFIYELNTIRVAQKHNLTFTKK